MTLATATPQSEDMLKGGSILYVVFRQSPAVTQILPKEKVKLVLRSP